MSIYFKRVGGADWNVVWVTSFQTRRVAEIYLSQASLNSAMNKKGRDTYKPPA